MNQRLIRATGVVAGLIMASSVLANTVRLINTSPKQRPMNVVYRQAWQNRGQKVLLSPRYDLKLNRSVLLEIANHGYQRTGIVLVSIAGHKLPAYITTFATSNRCSLATDAKHPSGAIELAYIHKQHGHGKITCATRGGIFNH